MNNLHNEVPTKVVTSSYSINDQKFTPHVTRTVTNEVNCSPTPTPTPPPPTTLDFISSVNNSGEPWDNIYKLLQQMNDLRDANSKLQKKVQFLEGMKLLTKLHQEIRDDPEFSQFFNDFFHQKYKSLDGNYDTETVEGDDDGVFEEDQENTNIIVNRNSNVSKTRESKKATSSSTKMTREEKISFLARQRSKSVGHEEIVTPKATERTKLISTKSKRFPRWARVKTALGWDKSSQSESAQGKGKKGLNEISSSGDAVSNTSGSEFINHDDDESNCIELDKGSGFKLSGRGGSERRILGLKSIISSRKNSVTRSSVKSSIETSSSRNRKDDPHKRDQDYKPLLDEGEDDEEDYRNSVSQISENGISITLGSGIKGSKSMGDISCNTNSRSKYLADNLNGIGKNPTGSTSSTKFPSKTKTGTAIGTTEAVHLKTTPSDQSSQIADENVLSTLDQTAIGKYAKSRYRSTEANTGSQRMPSMSPPVKRRSKWIKMRKVFANASEGVSRPSNPSLDFPPSNVHSVPASPMSSDTSFNYVMAWNENETGSGEDDGTVSGYEGNFENDQRRQEIDRSDEGDGEGEGDGDGEGDYMIPLSESATEPVLNLVQQLQRNLSEDFRKKIEEWERIKSGEVSGAGGGSRCGSSDGYGLGTSAFKIPNNVKVERKPSLPKLKKRKSDRKLDKYRAKYKDINWVEKELSRVSKEKEKLDRERAKFEERIKVLQKCKEDALATEKGIKKEIFVRTSEGEFRFEGITDDFTRKLYEWETKKGLCPESSIITLLDSSPGLSSCTTLGSPPSLDSRDKPAVCSTSKGVRHSQSTRHPLNRCISRSENSLIDLQNGETGSPSATSAHSIGKVTSTSLPSLKKRDQCQEYESILLSSATSPSPGATAKDLDSRRAHLVAQQQHVARQLFNLESSVDYQPVTIPGWGDSEKCMVTVNPDGSTIIVGSKQDIYEMTKEILGEAGDEGYISLLEANMFLLEKLNAKEDVCRNLEMQLKQLDAKMDEMNDTHRKEMEKYREKLWEIHGNKTSINPEESDKVIDELKERIEKLQLCSDRLRADKEALEDSFNYHSEQQAKLAIELIGKMRNLQEISYPTDLCGNKAEENLNLAECASGTVKCNPENVIKLHDISTRLLEKARELESALIERTKQICRLRWELLHREVSAMKLKTELHSSQLQDGNRTINVPAAKIKRARYGSRRSWSSSERLNYQAAVKGNQSGLDVDSWIISEDWPKIQKESSELSETVQQLKMELLKLASQAQSRTENFTEYEGDKLEGITGLHELFSSSLMKDLIQDGKHQNYKDRDNFTASNHHRSSNDNLDSFSGPEGSESSSLNDIEKASYVLRLPRNRWRRSRDNVSSSSESSFKEEESFTAAEWCRPQSNSYLLSRAKSSFNRVSGGVGGSGVREGRVGEEETVKRKEVESLESQRSVELAKEMVLSYGNHSMSRSSSEMTDKRNNSWEKLYKKRLLINQFSETSSSVYNEGLEESSSTSTNNNPFSGYYYDTPDSTQSNLRSSSSSGQDRYTGIPMIDEDLSRGGGSNEGGLLILANKVSEFQVIPEGQVMPLAGEERRHSEPCRKFKYSIRPVNRKLVCNSSLSMAEVKEDQTPSPVVYTIRLKPSQFDSKKNDDGYGAETLAINESQVESTAKPKLSSNEYIFCEPEENIFFPRNSDVNNAVPPPIITSFNQSFSVKKVDLKTDHQLKSASNLIKSIIKSTDGVEPLDQMDPVINSQYNRSPSSTSLTSLGSEQSIVRPRSSQDSQVSVKERDQTWAMNKSASKTSLTSKVASFINRRSRSKSRPPPGESTNQSAIGALCRQSIALTVNPETVINTTSSKSNVIVTEALVSATSTATATISLMPSSTLLVPSISSPSISKMKESTKQSAKLQDKSDFDEKTDETFLKNETMAISSRKSSSSNEDNRNKIERKSNLLNILRPK